MLAIFGSKKNLPLIVAPRVKRWAIFLLGYQYNPKLLSTSQHSNANGFLRFPLSQTMAVKEKLAGEASIVNVQLVECLLVTDKQLRYQIG